MISSVRSKDNSAVAVKISRSKKKSLSLEICVSNGSSLSKNVGRAPECGPGTGKPVARGPSRVGRVLSAERRTSA